MSRLALRVLGLPAESKPSSTPTSPSWGITSLAGASSLSLPRATSCMAAVPGVGRHVGRLAQHPLAEARLVGRAPGVGRGGGNARHVALAHRILQNLVG